VQDELLLEVLGMDEVGEGQPRELGLRVAEQSLRHMVGLVRVADRVDAHDADRGAVEHGAEARERADLLGVAERRRDDDGEQLHGRDIARVERAGVPPEDHQDALQLAALERDGDHRAHADVLGEADVRPLVARGVDAQHRLAGLERVAGDRAARIDPLGDARRAAQRMADEDVALEHRHRGGERAGQLARALGEQLGRVGEGQAAGDGLVLRGDRGMQRRAVHLDH
jgi:hypothetical protein